MDTAIDFNLLKEYAYNAGLAVAVAAIIYLFLFLVDYLIKKLKKRLLGLNLKSLRLFGLEIINVGKQELIITTAVSIVQILISVSFLYFALVFILSEIPATESIAAELVDLIFEPLQALLNSFVSYLPKLFTILVTILISQYLIKGVKYISHGVVEGSFHFPGFQPRTARTTGGIITFLIYVLTIIIVLPSMPGYESLAFKGIATFLGALITIGGSSVIANYMAGIVLTYMQAFDKGDWIEIDGIAGRVSATGPFAIRLESYKKETVNIPNSKVLGSAIRNYSGGDKQEMILHTEVSIGYDVSWKKVNELLIESARRTDLLSSAKEPFVLQKKLDDFYIVYELNAFLSQPEIKPRAHSLLHANILEVFNEAEIEIMSPHFRAQRDGTSTTIVKVDERPVDH